MSSEEPEMSELGCCGSGCNPCIVDVVASQKKTKTETFERSGLSTTSYLPFYIINIKRLTCSVNLYEFQAVNLNVKVEHLVVLKQLHEHVDFELNETPLMIKSGEYLILKGEYTEKPNKLETSKVPVSRPYTPLLNNVDEKGIFHVVVKLYKNGKMSTFLSSLAKGDIVFWRGPYTEFTYKTNAYKHLLLIAGGTGIAPLYNIAKSIVENDVEITRVKLIACFKTFDDVLLREQLTELKRYWNFQCEFYVSDSLVLNKPKLKFGEVVFFSKIGKENIFTECNGLQRQSMLVIICGPPPFNELIQSMVTDCGVKKQNIFLFR